MTPLPGGPWTTSRVSTAKSTVVSDTSDLWSCDFVKLLWELRRAPELLELRDLECCIDNIDQFDSMKTHINRHPESSSIWNWAVYRVQNHFRVRSSFAIVLAIMVNCFRGVPYRLCCANYIKTVNSIHPDTKFGLRKITPTPSEVKLVFCTIYAPLKCRRLFP